MSTLVEHKKFVCTDAKNNNNKFWEYSWYDDGRCEIRFGRVGASGQSDTQNFSRRQLDAKVRSKTSKGYAPIDIVAESTTVTKTTATTVAVKTAAFEQLIGNDPTLADLVDRLVKANKHELFVASGGQMNIDLSTGIISTPLGVVTKDNISRAKTLLQDLAAYVTTKNFDDEDFIDSLNSYLKLVPQKVAAKRGWHRNFIVDFDALQRQTTMLDQMEASVDLAESRLKQAVAVEAGETPKLFETTLSLVSDKAIIKEITDFYLATLSNTHACRNLRPKRVYEVVHANMTAGFNADGAKMKDVRRLWHGTRMFNVLSILKNGLVIPKSGGTYNITGRMFGDGLYFSDISTKSLNYSNGFWDNGGKENNCFMFLCDVAMGNYHVPRSSDSQLHKRGHDSVWARPGHSGIQNNEMIVFRLGQANLRYLVEFDV